MKNVVVTGASSGIGYNAVFSLRDRGYRVIPTVRSHEDYVHLTDHGFDVVKMDLTDSVSINKAYNEIHSLVNGRLYALFSNAYFGLPSAVEDLSPEALRRQFECLFGTFHLITLIMPMFRIAGEGRIIQNSSVLAFSALPFRGAYSSSKSAMESLTDTLRRESLLHDNFDLKVSILQPGPITSEFKKRSLIEFDKYIVQEGSSFREEYKTLRARLISDEPSPGTLSASWVTKSLIHALESQKPKYRYKITIPTWVCYWVQRLMPTYLVDKMFKRLF